MQIFGLIEMLQSTINKFFKLFCIKFDIKSECGYKDLWLAKHNGNERQRPNAMGGGNCL